MLHQLLPNGVQRQLASNLVLRQLASNMQPSLPFLLLLPPLPSSFPASRDPVEGPSSMDFVDPSLLSFLKWQVRRVARGGARVSDEAGGRLPPGAGRVGVL